MEYVRKLGAKTLAFIALVVLQSAVLLVAKAAAKRDSSGFQFSPPAAIAIAEVVKCILAIIALLRDSSVGSFSGIRDAIAKHVTWKEYAVFVTLAGFYATNNSITFVASRIADPGSIILAKSTTPFLVAVSLWLLYNRMVPPLAWVCVMLHSIGLILVQVDACSGAAVLPPEAYIVLSIALGITTVTSVINAEVCAACIWAAGFAYGWRVAVGVVTPAHWPPTPSPLPANLAARTHLHLLLP